jgi:predicted DNA-binding protein (UPF0251 family)
MKAARQAKKKSTPSSAISRKKVRNLPETPAATAKNSRPKTVKIGRTPILEPDDRTLQLLELLGQSHASREECAARLRVSPNTFDSFLKRHKKAAEALERGRAEVKISIRRAQIKSALAGNVTAQIWVGKNILNQSDRVAHVGHDGGAVKVELGISGLLAQAKAAKLEGKQKRLPKPPEAP